MDMNKILLRINQLPAKEQREMLELLSAIEEQKKTEAARKGFMDFTKKVWPDFIEGNHHRRMAQCFDRIVSGDLKRLIICMPPRHTKALGCDTEILTTKGWSTMGDLKVGDYVYGTNGLPTQVVGKSDVFRDRKCFKVTASDGSSVVADENHKWSVRLNKSGDYAVKTTGELASHVKKWDLLKDPRLPAQAAVEFPEKKFLIPPYVLGAWLGDGTHHCGIITSHPDDQPYMRRKFESYGYKTTDQKTRYTFGTLGLHIQLREIGVLRNKHIPPEYYFGSVQQRLEIIQGLMDTDGNISKSGQCYFANKNKRIIDSFRDILISLGVKSSMYEYMVKLGNKYHGPHYKVSFYNDKCVAMPRKAERLIPSTTLPRAIQVTECDRQDTVCIAVDAADHLFLAGRGLIPTHNSEFASHLLPAYYLGHNPKGKIIQASHTADLSVAFGRKTRNLMDTAEYKEIFPDVMIAADAKAAGRWGTNKGGEYYAVGVGGALAGRGANLMIIDDPVSEQDANMALANPEIYENIYEWYQTGPRQRLQPGGSICIVMTRWAQNDLVGKVLKKAQNPDSLDKWEVIEFPAILPSGRPLWPEFWSLESLQATKAALSVPQWNAQYMQAPTSEEGALLKRDWWRLWPENKKHPKFEAIIQSWDTAFLKTERSNYSACTTWGLFYPDPDSKVPNVLLLDAMKAKLEFPQLKKKAMELYNEWQPDSVVVEAKAAGAPLIYELRAMGIPIKEFTPSRGQDKIVRVNSITDIFASDMVWRPDTRWAEEVADECAAFPNGESDDIVDTVSQALLLMRQGGWIGSTNDNWDDELTDEWWRRRKADYY